jgi:hypothetical protein
MLRSRLSRLFAVALIAVVALSLFATASPASAATRGSITIHSRICPVNMPTGSNIYDQCHSHPGPEGARFKIDNRQSKDVNASGNVSFGQVTSGDHLVTLTSDFQPNEFLHMRAFCTNLTTGSGPNEAPIIFPSSSGQAQFWVYLASGGKLVCDVYFIPESGR